MLNDIKWRPRYIHKESMSQRSSSENTYPKLKFSGDSGLIVEFGDHLDLDINQSSLLFDRALNAERVPGIIETTPTIRSVLIRFDPLVIAHDELITILNSLLESDVWTRTIEDAPVNRWFVPAVYGGEYGPDLEQVASLGGRSEAAMIESHAMHPWRVLMVGFAPGQAYLGIHEPHWDIPRLAEINPRIPAGSIAIAIRQTVFYTNDAPTGWRVIARSPFISFRPKSDNPFPFKPGDEVMFEPIPESDFMPLAERAAGGELIARRVVL